MICDALEETLERCLAFRRVFRQAYTFQLKWTRMSQLVRECEATFERMERELDEFLAAGQRDK